MKILHLMLACFYIDNYSYQENMLPKYHKLMGHEVEIVSSLVSFDEHGNSIDLPCSKKYINEYGIPVTRLEYANGIFAKRLRKYKGLKEELARIKPSLIFIHGVQFADISTVVNYLKVNSNTIVYVDNHSDFSNSATNWFSKKILHEIIWAHYAKLINPYVKKFYGVLPARVDFLVNEYKLPREKVELLVMGADDELVKNALNSQEIADNRKRYSIKENDFLIITGGKIDKWKTQTLLLMKAVSNIDNDFIRLIVFGSVTEELQPQLDAFVDGDKIQFIGWVDAKESYKIFAMANLVVFPGRHSVFWEQVAAQGIPMIVKYWPGTTHVDMGGNVAFLKEDSVEEIQAAIQNIICNQEKYDLMKKIAVENGMKQFAYSDIASRCIQ